MKPGVTQLALWDMSEPCHFPCLLATSPSVAEFLTLCKFEVTNKGGLFKKGQGSYGNTVTTTTRLF